MNKVFFGVVVASAVAALGVDYLMHKKRKTRHTRAALLQAIGNTKMVRLKSLCDLTGCEVFAKLEYLNPGGSAKDRAARQIILDAEAQGLLSPGGTVYEGSAGSTGISLTLVGLALGYRAVIYMPDDQSREKSDLLRTLGAEVHRVPPVSIVDPNHFSNQAERAAQQDPNGFYSDQFENCSNWKAHFLTTGPEILRQAPRVDAFVMAAGTGGTMAGVSRYFQRRGSNAKMILIDPPGSSLFHRVNSGVAFSMSESEGKRKRHQVDTICEGIGITGRLTKNFCAARIDRAFQGTDQECVNMSRFLLENEGLFVGTSSAMNCVGVVKAARTLPPGSVIVTLLCDAGYRSLSKLWDQEFLESQSLYEPNDNEDFIF